MNASAHHIHNDEPAETDGLGREALSKEVALMASTALPPLALGVHGDWGAGKTTFMKHVRSKVENGAYSRHVITIWFDAWRYQNESAPVVALLQEMRRQFSRSNKLLRQANKLGEVTIQALLNNLDDLTKLVKLESLPVSAEKIQALGEQREKEHLENQLVTDGLQQHLQQAIATLLPASKNKTPRVVIFIDDLDRCNPEMAYRLLEGLKIYLNLKNCVFILGMNQQVITEAIAQAMKKHESDAKVKLCAEAYLEKLCTNIWRLPPPAKPHNFFTTHLNNSDNEPKTAINNTAQGQPIFLPPNPRRLKALANLYNRFWTKTKASPLKPLNTSEDIVSLIALRILVVAYVYQFHSELFQRWRHDPFFLEEMKDWVNGRFASDQIQSYFSALILPTRVEIDATQPTQGAIRSNYPDPSAPGIFWIAPLLQGPLSNDRPDDYKLLLQLENA